MFYTYIFISIIIMHVKGIFNKVFHGYILKQFNNKKCNLFVFLIFLFNIEFFIYL